jgi:hypothetical protein
LPPGAKQGWHTCGLAFGAGHLLPAFPLIFPLEQLLMIVADHLLGIIAAQIANEREDIEGV